MLTFKFSGADGVMSVQETLTAGMIGKQVKFEFTSDWDNLEKTAVFEAGMVSRIVSGVESVVSIPAEVLEQANRRLMVGIYGVDEEKNLAIPTIMVTGPQIERGADPSGDPAMDPSLPVWAQLQEEIEEIRADMAYTAIDITRITNNVGTVELGTKVNEVTISWTLNKDPASQTLDGKAVESSARAKTLTGLDLTGTKTFTLKVADERDATDSASTTVSFLRGVFYGALNADAAIDSAAIRSLGRSLQSGITGTFQMTAGEGQKFTFAAPVSYGEPTAFNVGGFDYTWAKVATFAFENSSGHTESYNVWMNDEVVAGTRTVKVLK